jgi:hypothetical protein
MNIDDKKYYLVRRLTPTATQTEFLGSKSTPKIFTLPTARAAATNHVKMEEHFVSVGFIPTPAKLEIVPIKIVIAGDAFEY